MRAHWIKLMGSFFFFLAYNEKGEKEKKGRIVNLQFYIKRRNRLYCFVVQNLQEAGMTIILKKNGCQNENK